MRETPAETEQPAAVAPQPEAVDELDEALEESFPASDPISPYVPEPPLARDAGSASAWSISCSVAR